MVIAGNWKMNLVPSKAVGFVQSLLPGINATMEKCHYRPEVVICVPFVSLKQVEDALEDDSHIQLGAQNMHFADKGEHTGEISAPMLKEMGVSHVIIGHSERRAQFGETDTIISKKVSQALKHKLTPIVCVGESYDERMKGKHEVEKVLSTQIRHALFDVKPAEYEELIVAYEPIWAIGTGATATNEQAEDACKFIRSEIVKLYDETKQLGYTSDVDPSNVPILYGGSVKPGNAKELFLQENIDGGLVGGASISQSKASQNEPETPDFTKIVDAGALALYKKMQGN